MNEKSIDRRISLPAREHLGVDDPAGSIESSGFGMVLVPRKTFNFRVKIESDIYVWDIRFLCISGCGADVSGKKTGKSLGGRFFPAENRPLASSKEEFEVPASDAAGRKRGCFLARKMP